VNPDELNGFRRHLVQAAANSAAEPVFRGRVVVGRTSLRELGLLDTTALSPSR
jgi:hypothetical protein